MKNTKRTRNNRFKINVCFDIDFSRILEPTWVDFGLQVGGKKTARKQIFSKLRPREVQESSKRRLRAPKSVPREPQERPKSGQECPKSVQNCQTSVQIAQNCSKSAKITQNCEKSPKISEIRSKTVEIPKRPPRV